MAVNRTQLEELLDPDLLSINRSDQANLSHEFPTPSPINFENSDYLSEGSGIEEDFIRPAKFPTIHLSNDTTDMILNGKTDFTNLDKVIRFIDANSWVIYTAIGVLTLLVLAFVILIIICILKNKQRVIRQHDDPILTSTYEDESSWCYRKCCCCFLSDKEEGMGARQNSASNLDPYRRQPLPSMKSRPNGPYISAFNILDPDNPNYEKFSAANINGINGVPQYPVRSEQYRQLPDLPKTE